MNSLQSYKGYKTASLAFKALHGMELLLLDLYSNWLSDPVPCDNPTLLFLLIIGAVKGGGTAVEENMSDAAIPAAVSAAKH